MDLNAIYSYAIDYIHSYLIYGYANKPATSYALKIVEYVSADVAIMISVSENWSTDVNCTA